MMVTIILLLVYLLGAILAWPRVKGWNNDVFVKIVASLLWPLTLILYGIYWIHKKL